MYRRYADIVNGLIVNPERNLDEATTALERAFQRLVDTRRR